MHIYTTNCMEEIETAAPSGIRLGGANFFTSLFSFHVNQHVAQLLDCCLAAMTLINLMRNYDDKFFSWSFQLWPRKGKEFVGKSNVFPQSSGITGSVLHRKVSSSPPHVIFVQKTDALWFWSCFFNLEIMFCFFNPKQEKKKKTTHGYWQFIPPLKVRVSALTRTICNLFEVLPALLFVQTLHHTNESQTERKKQEMQMLP